MLGRIDDVDGYHDIARWEGAETVPGLLVYRFDAPPFFVNADYLRQRVLALADASEDVTWLVLNAEAWTYLDATAIDVLRRLHVELEQRGIALCFARLKGRQREIFQDTDLTALIGPDPLLPHRTSSSRSIRITWRKLTLRGPRRRHQQSQSPRLASLERGRAGGLELLGLDQLGLQLLDFALSLSPGAGDSLLRLFQIGLRLGGVLESPVGCRPGMAGLETAHSNPCRMADESRLERRLDKAVTRATTPRGATIVIATVSIVMTVGAGLLMTLVDGESFPSIGSGLWWGVQTVTTVGYGDNVPTNLAGRLVAVLVMLMGIAFLTVITASITSTFVSRSRHEPSDTETAMAEQLHQVDSRLERIEAALSRSSSP